MTWFYDNAAAQTAPRNPAGWLVWALFGNVDDGVEGLPGLVEVTPGRFNWAWWRRNPAHNLCFVTLATSPREAGWPLWPVNGKSVNAQLNPPLFAFRSFGWEGYIGWRPRGLPDGRVKGVFGMALRR